MRKVTKEYNVYTFDELSDSAKENARQWMREGIAGDSFAVDTLLDNTVTDAAEMLGIRFVKRGAYPAIDWDTNPIGAAFNGSWYASKVAVDKLKADFTQNKVLHVIADDLAAVAADFPDASADCSIGRHCTQRVDMEFGYEDECGAAEESTRDALRAFASWIASTINAEIEYQNSDEAIDETIRANEYEFTESGEVA